MKKYSLLLGLLLTSPVLAEDLQIQITQKEADLNNLIRVEQNRSHSNITQVLENFERQTKDKQITTINKDKRASLFNQEAKVKEHLVFLSKKNTFLNTQKEQLSQELVKLKESFQKEQETLQKTQEVKKTLVSQNPQAPSPPQTSPTNVQDPVRPGVTANVSKNWNLLAGLFNIQHVGGWRPDSDGVGTGHREGLALDFMVDASDPNGDALAQYLIDHFNELGVSYIIWKQRYYSPLPSIYGPAGTWSYMPDRGSYTANHMDHVHVSFKY